MAYGKRKRPSKATSFKRRKVYKPKYSRPARNIGNKLQSCFVKCVRMQHIKPSDLASGATTAFGNVQFKELRSSAKFNRFASMYGFFRVHSMKAVFNAQGHVPVVQSSFDPDDDYAPTYQTHITSNLSCRTHQLQEGRISSRNVNLQTLDKYRDFMSCEGAQTQMQEEKYKAAIQYGFSGLHGTHWNIMVTEEYVVEFRHLRDKFSTDQINPGSLGSITAVGPEDQPMYFESTTNP